MDPHSWKSAPIPVQLCAIGVVLNHVATPYQTVDPIVKYVKVVGARQESFARWGDLNTDKMLDSLTNFKQQGFLDNTNGWTLTESGLVVYENLRKRYSPA